MVNDLTTITVRPGYRDLGSLAAAQATVPGLRVPTRLPQQARLLLAAFWYPPAVDRREVNGRMEAANIDYNVAPSLDKGHVVLTFAAHGGTLTIDQGWLASFANPRNPQLGPAATRRLASGRTVNVRDLAGRQYPQGRLRVVAFGDAQYSFSVMSDVLSVDDLAAIADTV